MLTGRTRFRTSRFGGKLILQLEYRDYGYDRDLLAYDYLGWRDATVLDFTEDALPSMIKRINEECGTDE